MCFIVWINCSRDLKNFANSWPSASNFKSFSRSQEQFILTVGLNNFGNKFPLLPAQADSSRIPIRISIRIPIKILIRIPIRITGEKTAIFENIYTLTNFWFLPFLELPIYPHCRKNRPDRIYHHYFFLYIKVRFSSHEK